MKQGPWANTNSHTGGANCHSPGVLIFMCLTETYPISTAKPGEQLIIRWVSFFPGEEEMIRKMLFNQTSEFYFDPTNEQAAATIKGYDKNGVLRTVHGIAYNVSDETMAFQTLNSFFEEELKMKYDYITEFGAAEKARKEMRDFIANLPPVNEGK